MSAQRITIQAGSRNVAAILAALLALAAVGSLYLVTSIPALESLFLLRTILSGEAIDAGSAIEPVMIAVPPVSAAVGAWWIAPYAIAGDRMSGVAMGSVTYLVATILGPVVAYASVPGAQASEVLSVAPMVSSFALFLLFPLLLLCAGFGSIWAALVRRAHRTTGPSPDSQGRLPVSLFVIGFAVLGLGWLPLAFLYTGLFSGGAFVD
jgi:hypothetical protein